MSPDPSLDYSEMNPRITYGLLKQPLPKRDAYTTPWYPRDGVKKLFNAMLFVSKPLRRWPSDTKLLFPNGVSVKQVAAAIEQMHAGIKKAFYCGLGHEIQFTESEIMVGVLLKLKAQNIVALPVHDAVVIRASQAEQAQTVMEQMFRLKTGVYASVHEEADGDTQVSLSTQ